MKKMIAKFLAGWAIKKIFTRKPKVIPEKSKRYTFEEPRPNAFWNRLVWFRDHGFVFEEFGSTSCYGEYDPIPQHGMLQGDVYMDSGFNIPVRAGWKVVNKMNGKPFDAWYVEVIHSDNFVEHFIDYIDGNIEDEDMFRSIFQKEEFSDLVHVDITDPEVDVTLFLNRFTRFLFEAKEKLEDLRKGRNDYKSAIAGLVNGKEEEHHESDGR